ncbi:MAG: hypothetical protein EHM55_08860 [Acidobacteria bacterium]|nr:MAG: hypothetical protein EHM55_08860 [Acidobacteriota bacterium]
MDSSKFGDRQMGANQADQVRSPTDFRRSPKHIKVDTIEERAPRRFLALELLALALARRIIAGGDLCCGRGLRVSRSGGWTAENRQ